MHSKGDWHRRFMQQAAWTSSIRGHLFNKAGIQKDSVILEVGCGTGAILDQYRDYPNLVGLDIDYPSLNFANRQKISNRLVCGDGNQLPFPRNTCDLIIAHFLFLWVTDPLSILEEMVRVGKPGGVILALAEPDYGARIDFPADLEKIGVAQFESLEAQGADATIGRKLGSLFSRAGLAEIETGILGAQWTQPLSEDEFELEWETIQSDIGEQVPPGELEALKQIDRSAWDNRERVLYTPTFYAHGKIKA